MKTLKSSEFFATQDYTSLPQQKQPIVVAYNLQTPYNIGSIIRIADNAGCGEVIFINERPVFKTNKIKKTADSSFQALKWRFMQEEQFFTCRPKDYTLIAIETAETSANIFEMPLPEQVIFMVGSEKYGIPAHILKRCHQVMHIPAFGRSKSLNVSHALAVGLFEWQRRRLMQQE